MSEIKRRANPLFLREEELRQGMELLFFAYRDFTHDADEILESYHFGRAHHRVIYFVGREPGLAVKDLLSILSITKQSLSRVLTQLVEDGLVIQKTGTEDRRQRLLFLTEKGMQLETALSDKQRKRIAQAYLEAGADAVEGFRKVLMGLTDEKDRFAHLEENAQE